MNNTIIIIFFTLLPSLSLCQVLSCENLLNILSVADAKQDISLYKKGFVSKAVLKIGDTTTTEYSWDTKSSNRKMSDSLPRKILKKTFSGNSIFIYQTQSIEESNIIKHDLLKDGFYFLDSAIADSSPLVFQHQNITVSYCVEHADSTLLYSFQFYKKTFPDANDMYYADDLLNFTSHEYLVYYFGEENVKKDICFFSDNHIARCSVLFLNTNRQVVFIWEDEVNRQTISNILIGGQQKLKSQEDYDKYIAESSWLLKSGIHAGMSLYELKTLHEAEINFYGGNAINTGEVLADTKGKIDFKKENVILGCMNCRDNKFSAAAVISADEAFKDGRILFVLSIVLNPSYK